jgi:hypothetical protein
MARRKKSSISFGRIAAFVALFVLAALGWWAWQHRAQWRPLEVSKPIDREAGSGAQGVAQQLSGKVQIVKAPRDKELGIVAPEAVILLRIVEMYQWHERCELAGGACAYDASWSSGHVDSSKFRVPTGHENPAPPFADARFVAGEVRLADLVVDPKLLEGHPAEDYPVKAGALPPNLAATFSVIDGALYAGGDAKHPQAGTLRIRYRVVPAGEVKVNGMRRGNRLEAK